jgi:hypothetical protein
VQQHLQRLDGVAKAEVSLRDGKVVVTPKEDGKIDPQKVMQATYDSGVSVATMEITAAGTLEESGDKLLFRINPKLEFQAAANEQATKLKSQGSLGKKISLRGRLFQKAEKSPKQKTAPKLSTIEIVEIVGGP